MAYVDYNYYVNTYGGNKITAENASEAFRAASDVVDTVTYCRIPGCGLEGLTVFQRGIIQRAVCKLADWRAEHADMLDSPYESYTINGVSATWGAGAGVRCVCGQIIPTSVYSDLVRTGLCFAGVR